MNTHPRSSICINKEYTECTCIKYNLSDLSRLFNIYCIIWGYGRFFPCEKFRITGKWFYKNWTSWTSIVIFFTHFRFNFNKMFNNMKQRRLIMLTTTNSWHCVRHITWFTFICGRNHSICTSSCILPAENCASKWSLWSHT